MAITLPREAKQAGPCPETPPLQSGDRLTRAEFERRYEAHPEIKKAELVEGVVYVASPVRVEQHCEPHGTIVTWLGVYRWRTPGVKMGDNGTVRLDEENEHQPDAMLRLESHLGGAARVSKDDYLEGAPELVVEVAASSASYDLHGKLRAYERNGVREYLVLEIYEQQTHRFVLRDGAFQEMAPDEEGILKSTLFPGLWLRPASFWADDTTDLATVLDRGLASPEHAEFVTQLQDLLTQTKSPPPRSAST